MKIVWKQENKWAAEPPSPGPGRGWKRRIRTTPNSREVVDLCPLPALEGGGFLPVPTQGKGGATLSCSSAASTRRMRGGRGSIAEGVHPIGLLCWMICLQGSADLIRHSDQFSESWELPEGCWWLQIGFGWIGANAEWKNKAKCYKIYVAYRLFDKIRERKRFQWTICVAMNV